MEKKTYSIEELQNIVYHSPTSNRGYAVVGVPRAFFTLHRHRKEEKMANRNDFELNKFLMKGLALTDVNYEVMVANYPDKKVQLIINPKDIPGPKRIVRISKMGHLSFGMGGLIEEFMKQNGMIYSEKKNFFKCNLEYKITFEKGKMLALEFEMIPGSQLHEYRD